MTLFNLNYVPQDVPQGVPQDEQLNAWILEQIKKDNTITTDKLALLSQRNAKTIKRHISKMPNIQYVGSGYSGHWEVK